MAERKTKLKEAISKSVDFLKNHFEIKEVILFGSQLTGKANEYSDIDLVVISPDFEGKSYEQILQVFVEMAVKAVSNVELHPFTTKDLEQARPTNFLGYVLKTGKVVFRDNKLYV